MGGGLFVSRRGLFPGFQVFMSGLPQSVSESAASPAGAGIAYSLDCQIEADEDPEFAEEFIRLRNDRARFGSVFIGRSTAPVRGELPEANS
jgi:hypothetical protein